MAIKKFTFKTERSSGRYASFYPDSHQIKLEGHVVGSIGDMEPHKISLCIIKKDINEDGNQNCPWKWITLKHKSKSLQEAKDFVNEYFGAITNRYNLYKFEKE